MIFLSMFSNVIELKDIIFQETLVTIQMTLLSGLIAGIIGLVIAIGLVLTRDKGLKPNAVIYKSLSALINLLRAIPFIILIVAIMPVTKFIVGTTIGFKGSIIPLIVTTFPFFARQFETALLEVSDGVVEAALSMGASDSEIIFRVYLSEALPGMIRATTITLTNLLGLTAMVGAVAGGGVGDLAIVYGFRHKMRDVTYLIVLIILLLVYLIELSGKILIKITRKGE